MSGKTKALWTVGTAGFVVVAGVVALTLTRTSPGTITFGLGSGTVEAKQTFSYDDYANTLKTYVDDTGMVNYKGLKAKRGKLDAFARACATLDAEVFEKWSEKAKIAFWINAYNALTLEAIIAHYPIKPGGFFARRYPKNSIRQIPGVWKKLQFVVMGKKTTLDEIEHGILRKRFDEPRIHVALVCAAISCPALRNEPFLAKGLDKQLDDQAARFLSRRKNVRIDRKARRVHLSSIFKWFGSDFVKTYGTDEKFKRHGKAVRAVLNFALRHLGDKDKKYLTEGKYSIAYLPYDWSLNEQEPPKKGSASKR